MLSYSCYLEEKWQQYAVKAIESLTGKKRLQRLYDYARTQVKNGIDVWTVAVNMLQVEITLAGESVDSIPKDGPLIIVANHPFGLLDGVVICNLLARRRSDFKILINRVLEQVEEIEPFLLPIDFSETKEAMRNNIESRKQAEQLLHDQGALIVFPSGGISTSKPFGVAEDSEWKTFTAKLVQKTGATVVPIYFHGQNSFLFQMVSWFSLTLRLSLLIKELNDRIGSSVQVAIGKSIPPESTKPLGRKELMAFLREKTYHLRSNFS